MGTPSYMSPAQARGDSSHLTTINGVFSLGSILFELLRSCRGGLAESGFDSRWEILSFFDGTTHMIVSREGNELVFHTICPVGARAIWLSVNLSVSKGIGQILATIPQNITASHYRTQAGAEVDLVLEHPNGEIHAIEIKRTLSPKQIRSMKCRTKILNLCTSTSFEQASPKVILREIPRFREGALP